MFLGSFQTMIKRHLHFMMNFAMIFLMAFFLLIYLLVNNSSYLAISNGQTEDISRLVCNMMNTELNTLLNQPQSIALSMANDSLIKNTLKEEPANLDSPAYTTTIANYLAAYRQEFSLSSSFLVSDYSKRYYFSGRVDRYLEDTPTNSWYYSLIGSDKEKEWNIDNDIVDGRKDYTLFVNATIHDDDGTLLGVIGTGMDMSSIGDTLQDISSQYDLTCILLNENQELIDSSSSSIGSVNDLSTMLGINSDQLSSLINENGGEWLNGRYVYSDDVSSTGWHIIAIRSAQGFTHLLSNDSDTVLLIVWTIAIITIMCFFIGLLIKVYSSEFRKIAEYDHLTGMPNRKYFERAMRKVIADAKEKETYLFIFDVDHFKAINDTCGHKAGDAALIDTSKAVNTLLRGKGMLFRWGGDEFCGVMMCSRPKELLEAMHQAVGELPRHLTISIGYTRVSSEDTVSMILRRADEALYQAKEGGRNQSCCREEQL